MQAFPRNSAAATTPHKESCARFRNQLTPINPQTPGDFGERSPGSLRGMRCVMKRAVLTFALIAAISMIASSQKIETESTDRKQIIHLKTALDHLTVIELGEPVLQVASGSPSFRVEWRENKVFVQPTEPKTRTNLFIWTATQRLNYELEPAGSVGDMDFAVDQIPVRSNPAISSDAKPQATPPRVTDLLLEAQPVRLQSRPHVS